MKLRLISFLLPAVAAVLLSSCVRTYTCQCEITYSGHPGLPDSSVERYTIKDTKSHAKSLCEANSNPGSYSADSTYSKENCYLY